MKLPDLKTLFVARAYWQAPGVHQLLAWARSRPTLGRAVANLDAKVGPAPTSGFLSDLMPERWAQWLRDRCDRDILNNDETGTDGKAKGANG